MLDKEQFFKEFSIDEEHFASTGLVWEHPATSCRHR